MMDGNYRGYKIPKRVLFGAFAFVIIAAFLVALFVFALDQGWIGGTSVTT